MAKKNNADKKTKAAKTSSTAAKSDNTKTGSAPAGNGKPAEEAGRDWSKTLFLPKTDFPMKAGLPRREPELLERWAKLGMYQRLREDAKGRDKYVLHDGPPYANGNIHLGTALNKILKDIITRSMQMMGKDSNYVPGWDCHGLPIEWKIEEQYRKKNKDKDAVPVGEFRAECRRFAEKWIDIQREEFKRLGVEGDWDNPYLTMKFESEAKIAGELMKFAMNGSLYRGSKPIMWSVVERTALAEAEVEYYDYESDTIWCKFAVTNGGDLLSGASIVIWTTTPWTIPGNRAVSYSPRFSYGLYEVTEAADDNWAKVGDKLVLADALADKVMSQCKVEGFERLNDVSADTLGNLTCHHPLYDLGYEFDVPLLAGDHVTDEDGTGFVHTAPGHGREDFEIWTELAQQLEGRGIDTAIPFTVGPDGIMTKEAPGFEGRTVITDKGKKGNANKAVIDALTSAGALIARGRLKHQYPHSWRSKKPVIFRNTPQWFIAMDKPVSLSPSLRGEGAQRAGEGQQHGTDQAAAPHTSSLGAAPHPNPLPTKNGERELSIRERSLQAIDDTRFVPAAGQNRLRGMIENKPDWVISRQRAWGVPICVFFHKDSGEILPNANFKGADTLRQRITDAFKKDGADAWFADGAKATFLDGLVDNLDEWEQVTDILDVWFDSGSTHSFVLEEREDLKWPADLYLEGSDQHRGWFHSSLIESCATRGRAPYDAVLTHGFVVAQDGRKMSKSLNNQVFPQDVIKQSGAEILRLWVASCDYSDDPSLGPEVLKSATDAYRKMRNTIRWMLGNLGDYDGTAKANQIALKDMPELERVMLHELARLDELVREGYLAFDFKRVFHALSNFCINDLSAFYFDIRKDALYCDPKSSATRRASMRVMDEIFNHLTAWLAPIMCFTMEEAWLARFPSDDDSVHLRQFPEIPGAWRNDELAAKWEKIRKVRRVVTGALEIERREKRIGSSLAAAPDIYVTDKELLAALDGIDLAEISITSGAELKTSKAPDDAFTLPEISGVGVVSKPASGTKCARSWKFTDDVGADKEFPELSRRDAAAVRELDAAGDAG